MTPQKLDIVFQALAYQTRRGILARLAKGEATVNELAALFGISQPSISRHLKVLEEGGADRGGGADGAVPAAAAEDRSDGGGAGVDGTAERDVGGQLRQAR